MGRITAVDLPARDVPAGHLRRPGTFIDCAGFSDNTCDGKTFQDAADAGLFTVDATLADLVAAGLLGDATLADIGAQLEANPTLFDAYSVADLLLGLIPTGEIPWESLDLTVPGVQNAQEPPVEPFQYLADFTLTGPADTVSLSITLPENFSYVPRGDDAGTAVNGAYLDGAAIGDPVLSVPVDDPTTEADESRLITLTFDLTDVLQETTPSRSTSAPASDSASPPPPPTSRQPTDP